MKAPFTTLFLTAMTLAFSVKGQTTPISVCDFVKIKNGKNEETMFYYQNNWKAYRDIALQQGHIKSYKMLMAQDTSAERLFDVVLITEYADSAQHAAAEENFGKIIRQLNPNGPKLLNDVKPADFRTIALTQTMLTIASSGQAR